MEIPLVVFALTKHCRADLIAMLRQSKTPIWVNHGLLSATELAQFRVEGIDITNFANWINPSDSEAVQQAVATIKEHHPNQAIFVEAI